MTRFGDELRGSEGERCKIADLRHGKVYEGTILKWNDRAQKATVKLDNGTRVIVGHSFVKLIGDEKP